MNLCHFVVPTHTHLLLSCKRRVNYPTQILSQSLAKNLFLLLHLFSAATATVAATATTKAIVIAVAIKTIATIAFWCLWQRQAQNLWWMLHLVP